MPSGRVEDFCSRLFFSVLLITFDFFLYAVAEPVWMESVSVASKVRDQLTTRFLREIRFDRREQGRFSAKPPRGPILHEHKARKYLCYCNRFIRSIPVSSDGKKVGEKVMEEEAQRKTSSREHATGVCSRLKCHVAETEYGKARSHVPPLRRHRLP